MCFLPGCKSIIQSNMPESPNTPKQVNVNSQKELPVCQDAFDDMGIDLTPYILAHREFFMDNEEDFGETDD